MINCIIISPKETKVYKNLQSVFLPAFSGQMQVLPGHVESFISLEQGKITFQKMQGEKDKIEILSGECHIKNDTINIIL